jgi:hypothetical protein
MSEPLLASSQPAQPGIAAEPGGPAAGSRALAVIGIAAVCAGVAALAAATFVLSYNGIHQFALHAGIAPRYARGYPWLIDAMLVIVLAAALSLRGAGIPSKLFAWACLVLLLAAAAGADALHAEGRRLPAHPAAVTAAVLPWGLVLVAFALLLTMLRHARLRRHRSRSRDQETARGQLPERAELLLPGFAAAVPQPRTEPDAGEPGTSAETGGRPVLEHHAGEDPVLGEAEPGESDPDAAELDAAQPAASEADVADRDDGELDGAEPGDGDLDDGESGDAVPDDPDAAMPVFHRMWSTPSPPPTDSATN